MSFELSYGYKPNVCYNRSRVRNLIVKMKMVLMIILNSLKHFLQQYFPKEKDSTKENFLLDPQLGLSQTLASNWGVLDSQKLEKAIFRLSYSLGVHMCTTPHSGVHTRSRSI